MSPVDLECQGPSDSSSDTVMPQHACCGHDLPGNQPSPSVAEVQDKALSDHSASPTILSHAIRQMINNDPKFRSNLERLRSELFHSEWRNLREPPIQSRKKRYHHGLPMWITCTLGCIIPFVMGIAILELVHTIQAKQEQSTPGDPIYEESFMNGGLP